MLPIVCFGQKDYCTKIKKSIDEKGTTYQSPESKYISVIKQFKIDSFFGLHLHFNDANQHFDAVGALVEFEDGAIIKDENAKVDCKQEMTEIGGGHISTAATTHSGEYLLQGFFHINEVNIEKFVSKKIIRIQLDNASQKIADKDATRIMSYIQCLRGRGVIAR